MNLDRRIGLLPSWQVAADDLTGGVMVCKTVPCDLAQAQDPE
jgi:hypothetical protein